MFSKDRLTAEGSACAALAVEPTPSCRLMAEIEFCTGGNDNQYVGVMPPNHDCNGHNALTKKACWSLNSNGGVYANGSMEGGTHGRFQGQTVTLNLTWISGDRSVLELTAPAVESSEVGGDATSSVTKRFSGLPTRSLPAVGLFE